MRYIIAILTVALLIILGIVVFWPSSRSPAPTPAIKKYQDLASTDATAILTTRGTINGDDAHREIRITISSNSRELDIIQGYEGNVIKSKSFYNNQAAFTQFLAALDESGFTKSRKVKDSDAAGACPLGIVYFYELTKTEENDQNLWFSTCGTGTMAGLSTTLNTLFQIQITNYTELTAEVVL